MESGNFDENGQSAAKRQKPANNSKLMANLMAVKNRQRVDENLNEASRGAPCKVVKLTKWRIWGKLAMGLGEYSNQIAIGAPWRVSPTRAFL